MVGKDLLGRAGLYVTRSRRSLFQQKSARFASIAAEWRPAQQRSSQRHSAKINVHAPGPQTPRQL